MANLKDLIVNGAARVIGKVYAPEFVGKLTGNADTATTATNLGTSNVGSNTTPIYLSAGTPTAISYTIAKNVPANAEFTDTKVTAVGNHYTPSTDKSSALNVDASSTTSASWNSTSLVTGVNISRDAKGHVTGLTVDSIKMPANPDTDTHYTAKNVVASSSTETANVTAATSNPYLNLIENGAIRSTHQIKGSGATTVKTDTSGNIIISSANYTKAQLLDFIYPVGSIYMSTTNTSPASFLGGEWEPLKNKFLVGAGDTYAVNATGGASSHAHTTGGHTLTENEIPKHTHGEAGGHTHTRGSMNITGNFFIAKAGYFGNGSSGSGAFSVTQSGDGNNSGVRSGNGTVVSMDASRGWNDGATSSNGAHTHSAVGAGWSHSHGDTGSSSNIPPYLAVYMWKRTA